MDEDVQDNTVQGPSIKRAVSFASSDSHSVKAPRLQPSLSSSSLVEPSSMDGNAAEESQCPPCPMLECHESKVRDMLADGKTTAMYIHDFEWFSLLKGSRGLLRSFRTRDPEIILVMKKEMGHVAVGCLAVVACHECNSVRQATQRISQSNYPSSYLTTLKAGKTYVWDVTDVVQFGQGCTLQWVGQKHKNRTFKITANIARFDDVTPKDQNMFETAKFLLSNFSLEQQAAVKAWAQSLTNSCIRVGTTCSGTDVCISVLKQTIQYINHIEAGYYIYEFYDITIYKSGLQNGRKGTTDILSDLPNDIFIQKNRFDVGFLSILLFIYRLHTNKEGILSFCL